MSMSPNSRPLSRRTLARGAAWSLPVVAVASAAPLASASTACSGPQGCPQPFADATLGRVAGGPCGPSQYVLRFSGTVGFSDAKTGSQLSDAVVTLFLPDAALDFSGPAANGWTALARDTSQSPIVDGGTTYFAYSTSYQPAIQPTDGTFELPRSGTSVTGCVELTPEYFFTRRSTVVNGAVVTATSPRTAIPTV